MKNQTPNTLWGIYYTDREFAEILGDPLRTVIQAPTKVAAEEIAARLGFSTPWAHPVTPDEAKQAQWLPPRLAARLKNGDSVDKSKHDWSQTKQSKHGISV